MKRRTRWGLWSAPLFVAAALAVWAACVDDDGAHDDLPGAAEPAAIAQGPAPRATAQSEPSPSGFVLEVTAPELVVQSCAVEVTGTVTPQDPASPLVSATLMVSDGAGGLIYEAPATALDPGTGTASWAIARAVTEIWIEGPVTLLVTAQLGNGESLLAELPSQVVAMNVLWIEIDGTRHDDGGRVTVSCTLTPPIAQPSTPIGGYTTPSGGTIPCGPVVTTAVTLPPNVNSVGQPVLSLSPSPATSFTITVVSFGEAQVQFTSALVRGAMTTITIAKAAPACPLGVIRVWFNHKEGHTEDAMELRYNFTKRYDVSRSYPEWSAGGKPCPDDLVPPEARMGADSNVCYAIKPLSTNTVKIQARFKGIPGKTYGVQAEELPLRRFAHLKVEANPIKDTEDDPPRTQEFADVAGKQITIPDEFDGKPNPDGCSAWEVFSLTMHDKRLLKRGVHVENIRLRWTYTCEGETGVAGDTDFILFVVVDTPQPPWNTARAPNWTELEPVTRTQAPWIDALEGVCTIAARRDSLEEANEDLVRWLFVKSGFRYQHLLPDWNANPALADPNRPSLWKRGGSRASTGLTIAMRDDWEEGWGQPIRTDVPDSNPPQEIHEAKLLHMRPKPGAPKAGLPDGVSFQLTTFISEHLKAALVDALGNSRDVICSDIAGSLVMMATLVGSRQRLAAMSPAGWMPGGTTDALQLIGIGLAGGQRVNNPFFGSRVALPFFMDVGMINRFQIHKDGSAPPVDLGVVAAAATSLPGDKPVYDLNVDFPPKTPFSAHMTTYRALTDEKGKETGEIRFDEAMVRKGEGSYLKNLSRSAYLAASLRKGGTDFQTQVMGTNPPDVLNLNAGAMRFR